MGALLPWGASNLPEGILPLFEDPYADDVMISMPRCNEYGLEGTTEIDPPPQPRDRGPIGAGLSASDLARGDFSPEDPGASYGEDEGSHPKAHVGSMSSRSPSAGVDLSVGAGVSEQSASSGSLAGKNPTSQSVSIPPLEISEESCE